MLGNNKNKNFIQFVVFGKYDFTAEECDEITFKRGDPILVLEKDDEHKDGWWKGKTVDKLVGLFPVEFTTFINIKQINIDGLFEELEGPLANRRESMGTSISSASTNNNFHIPGNASPHPSLNEIHTPKTGYSDQSNATNSPSNYSNIMSFSSVSGMSGVSPQIMQVPPHLNPPNLSIGHPATTKLKEYQILPPTSWSVDNVIDWLEEIGFGACSQIFRDNNITGIKLLDQSLATLRELGINQLKDRLKLFNSIVTLKERYAQITQANQEQEINNSMINEPSRQWEQHSRLYDDKYIIEEEKEGSVINDSMSVSSVTSNNTRRNEYINSALAENRNNTRQINGPVGMRPRLNSIVSRESLQLTNTNFSYYRSAQRANRAPSQSSKSSISSISSFFRRLSFSKPSKKNDSVFEPMFQQADYQGWLWTRFDKNAKWKKRWIILSREKVYFLKEPKHPVNIKHTIQLNITFSIQPDIHKGKTKYTFNLIDSANQQITYFSADNHLVMMTWINVLVRATTNAASRLQPCPEGKSPIIPPQSPATGITPIYGISSQSPYHQPHQVQQSPQHNQSPQVIRNSGYIPSGRPSMISQNVSPRIQQAIITHNLPTQVRKSSMGMMNSSIQNSPQQVRIQTHSHHHQSQLTHSPIEGNITPPNTSVIIENKEE